MRTILSIVLILVLLCIPAYWYLNFYNTAAASSFRTAQVERGEMLPTIEATGTVEPEQVVDIGSQVNGLITELKADYGSNVKEGEVLAQIDPTMYQATVDQTQAAVTSAKANLALAQANLAKAEADMKRDNELIKKGAIAPSDYDTAVANLGVAKATVGVNEAAIKQAEATLRQSAVNLGYCSIKSPVKGTIVDRRVNVGQDVVSSLSASSLFLLAKDLTKIQVWASVNEADIGRIRKGVKVHFTVDAYPNDVFSGEVLQVRLNATMTQNVVTYTVVVVTDNKDMRLLPYMTASLHFEIDHHENVLKVPNAALRWKPRPKQIAPDVREETLAAMNGRGEKSGRGQHKKAGENGKKPKDSAQYSALDTQNSEQPAPAANSAAAGQAPVAQAPAGKASGLATSAGTATGLSPEDWKARKDKQARKDATTVASAPPGARPAGGRHPQADHAYMVPARPGRPVAAPKTASAVPPGAKPAGGQPPGQPIDMQTVAAPKEHKEHHESGRLWKVDGNFVRPVEVKIIATDGTMTEVRGKDLSEGMDVAIGENVANEGDSGETNPFMPRLARPKSTGSK